MTVTPRILAIDDQKELTDIIEEIGKEEGLVITSVNDYEEIRKIVRQTSPHLIFLDLDLGMDRELELADRGYDGLDIIQFLAEQNCRALIILMSGLDKDKLELTANHGRELGLKITGVLPKPFSIEQMSQIFTRFKAKLAAASKKNL